jgi:DNA replication protein DnaC
LRESGLPLDKTFRTLQLEQFGPRLAQQIERLRSGSFVQQAVNVVAVGKPGTGKSHVAAAVGHELIAQGQTVYWSSTAALVQRLLAAKRDLRLPRELAKLDRVVCLILDDIGYVQHDRDEMEVLFTLLAPRYPYCMVPFSLRLTDNQNTKHAHPLLYASRRYQAITYFSGCNAARSLRAISSSCAPVTLADRPR